MAATPNAPRFNPSMPVEVPPPLHLPPPAGRQRSNTDTSFQDPCAASLPSRSRTSETLTEALAEVRWKRKRPTELNV